MCSYIVQTAPVVGSAKGAAHWFPVTQVNVNYDHPVQAFLEHAVSIDFVNESLGTGARVAVEISAESARELIRAIERALAAGDEAHLEVPASRTSGA